MALMARQAAEEFHVCEFRVLETVLLEAQTACLRSGGVGSLLPLRREAAPELCVSS